MAASKVDMNAVMRFIARLPPRWNSTKHWSRIHQDHSGVPSTKTALGRISVGIDQSDAWS